MTDAPPADTARRGVWRTLMIFALAGPYIGLAIALVLMTGFGLAQVHSLGEVGATMAAVGALAVISSIFAIPIGGLPGLLTGLVAVSLHRRGITGSPYYVVCAIAGGLATAAIPILLKNGYSQWLVVGAATGLICAHLARRR